MITKQEQEADAPQTEPQSPTMRKFQARIGPLLDDLEKQVKIGACSIRYALSMASLASVDAALTLLPAAGGRPAIADDAAEKIEATLPAVEVAVVGLTYRLRPDAVERYGFDRELVCIEAGEEFSRFQIPGMAGHPESQVSWVVRHVDLVLK